MQKKAQKSRCKYDAFFNVERNSTITSGRPVLVIACSLGLNKNVIDRWRENADSVPQTIVKGKDHQG